MQVNLQRITNVLFFAAIATFATALPAQDDGGGGDGGDDQATAGVAGVQVDPSGVLRTRYVRNANGRLTKKRLAQLRAALDPDVAQPSKLRKISLNRLEAALAARVEKGFGATDDMRFLAGLTRVRYVFFYPETSDIVLAGPAEGYGLDATGRAIGLSSGQAVIQLEDLIVALRSFAPHAVPTRVISCSIDATQQGLLRAQQFLSSLRGIRPSDDQRIAHGLRRSVGLQTVTIRGVSPKTHFAQVLVEADYRMKLIGIGKEVPPVGIVSYVKRARPSDVARNALLRWYFVPNYDSVEVSEDHFAMELVGNGVKLIGADEMVRADGSRAESSRIDRASQTFVTSFTKKYGALARVSPVFAQLRNAIDLSIAAAHIQTQDFYSLAGWELGVFAREDDYPVETLTEPKTVETAVHVVWKRNRLMTPFGGGVNIQALQTLQASTKVDQQGDLDRARTSIHLQDLGDRWWWD